MCVGGEKFNDWNKFNNEAAKQAIERTLEGWTWRDVNNSLGCITPSHMPWIEIAFLAEAEMMVECRESR